jgi:hypothetical protein
MCIGTGILSELGWTAFSLTENWEIYADYTARGIRIQLANQPRLYALETESLGDSRTRRSRWSRGRASVLHSYGRRIMRSTVIGWHQKLDALAELGALPPTVHTSVAVALAAACFVLGDGAIGTWLGAIALMTLLPLSTASLGSLARDPEPLKTATALLRLPLYAVWRGLLLLEALFLQRGSVWQKTERR